MLRFAVMSVEARRVRVRGIVQGVAFRHFTKVRARELDLAGWVANHADGSVEVWAEGTSDRLETLVDWLRRGPPAARVESLDVRVDTPRGHTRFVVVHEA